MNEVDKTDVTWVFKNGIAWHHVTVNLSDYEKRDIRDIDLSGITIDMTGQDDRKKKKKK